MITRLLVIQKIDETAILTFSRFNQKISNGHLKIVGPKSIPIAKLVSDSEFPRYENVLEDDLFDTTLSREFLDTPAITTDDLKIINQTFNQIDIVSLQETLNELLNAVKTGEASNKNTLLDKLEALLINTTGTTSNSITIANSYKSGASLH